MLGGCHLCIIDLKQEATPLVIESDRYASMGHDYTYTALHIYYVHTNQCASDYCHIHVTTIEKGNSLI